MEIMIYRRLETLALEVDSRRADGRWAHIEELRGFVCLFVRLDFGTSRPAFFLWLMMDIKRYVIACLKRSRWLNRNVCLCPIVVYDSRKKKEYRKDDDGDD